MKFRYKLNALYPDSQVHFPQPQSVAMGWDDRGPHLRMFLEDAQEYEAHTVRLRLVTDDPFVLGLVVRWFRHGQELRAPIYTPVNIHRLGGSASSKRRTSTAKHVGEALNSSDPRRHRAARRAVRWRRGV